MWSQGQYQESLADGLRANLGRYSKPGLDFHTHDAVSGLTLGSQIDADGPLAVFASAPVSRPASSTMHSSEMADPFKERLSLMLGSLIALITGASVICAAIILTAV